MSTFIGQLIGFAVIVYILWRFVFGHGALRSYLLSKHRPRVTNRLLRPILQSWRHGAEVREWRQSVQNLWQIWMGLDGRKRLVVLGATLAVFMTGF